MTGKRSKQQDCGYKRVLRVLAKLIADTQKENPQRKSFCASLF